MRIFLNFVRRDGTTATFLSILFLLSANGFGQKPSTAPPEVKLPADLDKYPGLLPEFGNFAEKLQHSIQFPTPRNQSRLLPLLPESTVFYAAFPNYGDAVHQALLAFQLERQQSSVLRDWWEHSSMATSGPQIENSIEKFYEFSQYLGDEIVVSATLGKGGPPGVVIFAEIKKPGLKIFLEQTTQQFANGKGASARVLDQRELATAKDTPKQEPVVLVRPDFVIGATDVATLRSFSAHLDRKTSAFAATAFGRRIAEAYAAGTTIVAAADLQKIVGQVPIPSEQSQAFQRTGFADMKYLVWSHTGVAGRAASESELSFTGPQHGVASWLESPRELTGLDFVSPNAIVATSVALKNLAQVFDDVRELATASNPTAFAMIDQMQQGMGISLRNDLFSLLSGEITLEVEKAQPDPVWKAILSVNDPEKLQHTLSKLLAMAPVKSKQVEEGGVTYHNFRIPSANKTVEISYALADGYLLIGSGQQTITSGIRAHRSGESLAKSKRLLAAMPTGHSSKASALFYEDPAAISALKMQQWPPETAGSLSHLFGQGPPAVIAAYGDEDAIRVASASNGVDTGVVLAGVAIAMPNLLRARTSANESSAVGSIRTLVTAEATYSATYPDKGYARNLAALGPDPRRPEASSPEHAALIESSLGNPSCTAGKWCEKSGYRFTLASVCSMQPCEEFVAIATPVSASTGERSFCSTSDGVIRSKSGVLLIPLRPAECRKWIPLQ